MVLHTDRPVIRLAANYKEYRSDGQIKITFMFFQFVEWKTVELLTLYVCKQNAYTITELNVWS